MDHQKYLSSDEVLEKIFYYMSRLFEEKELSTTLFLLTDLGKTLVNSDRASFWFWDKRKAVIWTLAALGTDTISLPENSGLVGASMMNNEILIINDPYSDPRFNPEVDKETGQALVHYELAVPMLEQPVPKQLRLQLEGRTAAVDGIE